MCDAEGREVNLQNKNIDEKYKSLDILFNYGYYKRHSS
jgi:hypothetical protein